MPPKQKKEQDHNKLDELMERLEKRLAVFDDNELKKHCLKTLVAMRETIEQLEQQHRQFYELLGLTWGDINYP